MQTTVSLPAVPPAVSDADSPVSFFTHLLQKRSMLLLGVLLLGASAAISGGAVDREDAQTVLFPFVLLLVWQLPRLPVLRVPSVLLSAAAAFWLVGTLNVRGYLPSLFSTPGIYLAKIEGDTSDLEARAFERRYRDVSRTYSLPGLELVHRRFDGAGDATRWLTTREQGVALLSGNQRALRLYLSPKAGEQLAVGEPIAALSNEMHAEARKLGLKMDGRVRGARLASSDIVMAVGVIPESIELPNQAPELVRHYVGWMARALRVDLLTLEESPLTNDSHQEVLALQRDALNEAMMVEGAWTSYTPTGFAQMLVATGYLLQSARAESDGYQEGVLKLVRAAYSRSKRLIRQRYAPDIYAMVLNNDAVVRLLQSESDGQRKDVRRMLWQAAAIKDANGGVVLGAKLAYLNLLLLERKGVL